MLLSSLAVAATWLSRAWVAYLTHWRVALPATIGVVFGLWFSSFLVRFGVGSDFSRPLGLPVVCFRLLVVLSCSIGFAVIGKRFLDEHFPRHQ